MTSRRLVAPDIPISGNRRLGCYSVPSGMPGEARSCTELDSLVRVLSRKYMKKLNAQAMAYDRETNHGVKQGAQLK